MNVLKYADLRTVTVMVPTGGMNLEALSPDGEMLAEIGLMPGAQRLDHLLPYFPAETVFRTNSAVCRRQGGRAKVIRPAGREETGANPDYRPQRMTEGEARLHKIVKGLQQRVDGISKRDKHTAEMRAREVERRKEHSEPKPEPDDQGQVEADPDTAETEQPAE
jgi:hypothetical protein